MNEFYIVERIISDLQKEVSLYESLFGNEESVQKLNNSFPEVFSIFQHAMFFEIICRISALFDPASMRSKKNLTLAHLADLCGDKITENINLELESIKSDFKKTGIKDIRNKEYAHNDLNKYLGKKELATNITYDAVSKLLRNMFSVVRNLGIQSGMVLPDQIIVRDIQLPREKDGPSLLQKIAK